MLEQTTLSEQEEYAIPEEKKNDFMWILQNRIFRIFNVITQYGEENFFISFSGGKDSTVLSALIDMALPNNRIPRVYANTGIELNMIRDFVFGIAEKDDRVVIIKPTVPIKKMLEEEGYPFKSKQHSVYVKRYKTSGKTLSVKQYLGEREDKEPWSTFASCPKALKYQFTDGFDLNVSDKCCVRLKEYPIKRWSKTNNRPYSILGLMRSEGGRRHDALCLAFSGKKLKSFSPLVQVTKQWEDWFIEKYNIELCDLYKEPYNFTRTGCKGCPFAKDLQRELDVLQKFFPQERKQCERIWKPVYDEYRRIGYRLKNEEQLKLEDLQADIENDN